MKTISLSILIVVLSTPAILCAQQTPPAAATVPHVWTKTLADKSKRGTLHDATQMVRGDTGKWSDQPQLSHASPLMPAGTKIPLDARLDQLLEQKSSNGSAAEEQWLLFRTRQLDDNDRLWIERIERQGNKFTIVLDEAIWQGKYFKTFTYYQVYGVNLGKLPPGKYEATWIVKSLKFKQFDGDGRPTPDRWPKDEVAAEKKPTELRTTFAVAATKADRVKDEQTRLDSLDIDGLAAVDRTWSVAEGGDTPSFTKHVVPLFNKVGCSNRSCHGSFQGQGGFRLSLFGYDPTLDHEQLRRNDGRGSRIDVARVDESLALRKPLGRMPHGGDQVLEDGSWQHLVLRRWIADGAPYLAATAPTLTKLVVHPRELRLETKETEKLRTVAHFSDGTREEVTALTTFASNNESVAAVGDDGRVVAGAAGDTAIVVSYAGGVLTCPVIVPQRTTTPFPDFPPNNRIDEFVAAKLRKVGIQPAELSDDEEFFRRVHIDLIGTLPTADEVRSFLANKAVDKRAKVIDALLERPEYVLYWATILSDWTGNNGGNPNPAHKTSWLWYDWLCDKLRREIPYDELVGAILTATSREGRSLEEFLAETKAVDAKIQPRRGFDDGTYAKRKTLDLFWLKRTSELSKELSTRTAENFLGVQIQCAECHKHPFDRWTQADFEGFTSFFRVASLHNPDGRPFNLGGRDYNTVGLYLGVAGNERSNVAKHPPKILGGPVIGYTEGGPDPRVALWTWMRSPDNPYFARNLVNRFWHHYFGVGIVDPPQDMNAANPPSNAELLDWLARDFIEHGFDLKHVHRTILNSRTYQLSHRTNDSNRGDRRNFSHALVKRMPAEAALDAIVQVTGTKLVFNDYAAPRETRSIGMALSFRIGRPEYFMETFGRPPRRDICSCERSGAPALSQALFLINDDEIHSRIADPKGRLPQLLHKHGDDRDLAEELYLSTLSRRPRSDEIEKVLAHFKKASSREAAAQDLLWTLLNVREFLFVR